MDVRWKAGLAGFLASVLLTLQLSPTAQASSYEVSVSGKVEEPLWGASDRVSVLAVAGKTCSVEITVTNEGDISDSYTLEVNDIAGWNLELQENQWTNVGPGESRMTTLSVIVPGDAEIGSQDNVFIKAIGSAGAEDSFLCMIGVLRGDVTNWGYVATGIGVVIAAIAIVLVLWKGGI
jgi:uncharacterized membrane protein